MIQLARVWYNFIADYHDERALDHARRRDRALRELERLERDRRRRDTQREIRKILNRRPEIVDSIEAHQAERRADLGLTPGAASSWGPFLVPAISQAPPSPKYQDDCQ